MVVGVCTLASTAAAQSADLIFSNSFERVWPRVTVILDAAPVPPDMAGDYDKAFNCTLEEGGANFGGVDHEICFRKADASPWRIWNTGCGWEIGRVENDSGSLDWERYARSYTGLCSQMPKEQISTRILIDNSSYVDAFGDPINGISTVLCEHTHVDVSVESGSPVPPEMAGLYDKAFDCTIDEGGAAFSGVDHNICFRKTDASSWRIWNTGCGWEIGRLEGDPGDRDWQRYARTYSGQCSSMPPIQIDTRALITNHFFDRLGDPIPGIESRLLEVDSCE
jgi:hypothetical protein